MGQSSIALGKWVVPEPSLILAAANFFQPLSHNLVFSLRHLVGTVAGMATLTKREMSMKLKPLVPMEIEDIPIDRIDRSRKLWHVRTCVRDDDVARLAQTITSTGRVVPIHVVVDSNDVYSYVSGLLRLLAVERLGHHTIPAMVDRQVDAEVLLCAALAEQEMRFPVKTLERGWALERLQGIRERGGLPNKQRDIARITGMDEGTVSAALKAARSVPQTLAEECATAAGLAVGDVALLGRNAVRMIARTPGEENRRAMVRAACSALASNGDANLAVRQKYDSITSSQDATARRSLIRQAWNSLRTRVVWLKIALSRLMRRLI